MSERSKEWKKINLLQSKEDFDMLAAEDYQIQVMSEYHFRINDRLDVWPSTRKWYDIKSGAKGEYKSMVEFVISRFKMYENSI